MVGPIPEVHPAGVVETASLLGMPRIPPAQSTQMTGGAKDDGRMGDNQRHGRGGDAAVLVAPTVRRAERPAATTSEQANAVRMTALESAVEKPARQKAETASLEKYLRRLSDLRSQQPSPGDVVGLPDALLRFDANSDGRLDRVELERLRRNKADQTSFRGMAGRTFEEDERLFVKTASEEQETGMWEDTLPVSSDSHEEVVRDDETALAYLPKKVNAVLQAAEAYRLADDLEPRDQMRPFVTA